MHSHAHIQQAHVRVNNNLTLVHISFAVSGVILPFLSTADAFDYQCSHPESRRESKIQYGKVKNIPHQRYTVTFNCRQAKGNNVYYVHRYVYIFTLLSSSSFILLFCHSLLLLKHLK